MKRSNQHKLIRPLADFLRTEAASGALVVTCIVIALFWANGPWSESYRTFWSTEFSVQFGNRAIAMDLRHWINDALMALFFFVLGLELKREFADGAFHDRQKAALPLFAALGGMLLPALVFLCFTVGTASVRGWAIPMATDTGIALGVLALLGTRVRAELKAFLLALAVIDDIGAIAVLALVYSPHNISVFALSIAVMLLLVIAVLRVRRVTGWYIYLVIGLAVWFAVLAAGIHATLAGVALALVTPTAPFHRREYVDAEQLADISSLDAVRETVDLAKGSISSVEWLQYLLHPWSSYVILPLFALANAGVELDAQRFAEALVSPLSLGIMAALVIGKPLGIVLGAWLAMRLLRVPSFGSHVELIGIGAIAGIGFTMSVFLAELAFDNQTAEAHAKIGILLGSFLAGIIGYVVARAFALPRRNR